MARWQTLFVLSFLLLGIAACGGDDDDDDDTSGDDAATQADAGDDGDDNGDDGDDGRTDASDATGSLTIDGDEYTLDMETCEIRLDPGNLTVLAGTLEGESDAEFSASGIDTAVSIAVRFGQGGYIAPGAELNIDGSSVDWEGKLVDPSNPTKEVDASFSVEC